MAPSADGARGFSTRSAARRRHDPHALLVLGLVLRASLRASTCRESGFAIDIGDFAAWGQRLASIGPGAFYEEGYFSDYPPGLPVRAVAARRDRRGPDADRRPGRDRRPGQDPGDPRGHRRGWMLFVIARRWGGELLDRTFIVDQPVELRAAWRPTLYLFNPGVIFDSAVWGQIDSVGTLLLLATIYALGRGWIEAAALGAVVAMLVKFQFAFLIPVVLIVGLKRHLFGRSSDPEHDGKPDLLRVVTSRGRRARLADAADAAVRHGHLRSRWRAATRTGCSGILPEADPTTSLVGKLVEAANTYTGLSINAFNLWRNPWSGLGDTLVWGDDTDMAFALGGIVAHVAERRGDPLRRRRGAGPSSRSPAATTCAASCSRRWCWRSRSSSLPTRVHERYLFPALALGAPLFFSGRAWPWIYARPAGPFFANIYWVYTEDWSFAGDTIMNPGANGLPMPQDPFLTATLLTDWGIWALGLLVTVVLLAVLWFTTRSRPRARRGRSRRPLRRSPASPSRLPQPEPVFAVDRAAAVPRWLGRQPRRRLPARAVTPARPPRRAHRPRPRRLRARLPRLAPRRPEAATTSTRSTTRARRWSSSANWDNDWTRDVYEWTHPMLAKYLIAGGIERRRSQPGRRQHRPRRAGLGALAVAPRRASVGHERSVVFTAAGRRRRSSRPTSRRATRSRAGSAGGPVAALGLRRRGRRAPRRPR